MAAKRSSVVRGRVGVTMSSSPLTLGDGEESAVLGSNTSPTYATYMANITFTFTSVQ